MGAVIEIRRLSGQGTWAVHGMSGLSSSYPTSALAQADIEAVTGGLSWSDKVDSNYDQVRSAILNTADGGGGGGPPTGAAGGELSGTYPDPVVATSGLAVKVANTIADAYVKRNATDDGWVCDPNITCLAASSASLSVGSLLSVGTTAATKLAFFGAVEVPKPTVAGIKVDAVAASILAALVALGLVTDNTT